MTSFSAAMQPWIDADGLIGSSANPPKWSSGNGILETAIACIYETKLNDRQADTDFLKARQAAIAGCQNPDGSFDKNPGRPDQITQDDLKGAAGASRVCGMPFARAICDFGAAHNWVLSNTGFPYWTACAKPWDKAIYLYCATRPVAWYESVALAGAVLFDAYKGDPSSNRLMWVSTVSLGGVNGLVDTALFFWKRAMTSRYRDVGGLMKAFYLAPDRSNLGQVLAHPFVVFGRSLSF